MEKEAGLMVSEAGRLIHVVGENLTTTSRIVAEVFGKQHDNVIRDIKKLGCSDEFRLLNFEEGSYLDVQGQSRPMIEMTRDGFTLLAMGYTGKKAMEFKEKFLAAFNWMEKEIVRLREKPQQVELSPDEMLLQALQGSALVFQRQLEDRKKLAAHDQALEFQFRTLTTQSNRMMQIEATQDSELCLTAEQEKNLMDLRNKLIDTRAFARKTTAKAVASGVHEWIKRQFGTRTFHTVSRAQYPMAMKLLRTEIVREEASLGQVKLLRPQDF